MTFRTAIVVVAGLTFAGLFTSAPVAHAGQEGHGGDPAAAEFVAKAWKLYNRLMAFNELYPDVTDADLDTLRAAIEATRVEAVPYQLQDHIGNVVVARVIPDPLRPVPAGQPQPQVIQVNRHGLYEFLRHGIDLTRLVLHEYLWVIGKNDENYRISGRLDLSDPDIFLNPSLTDDICRDPSSKSF
jgi:hypothetical protein